MGSIPIIRFAPWPRWNFSGASVAALEIEGSSPSGAFREGVSILCDSATPIGVDH